MKIIYVVVGCFGEHEDYGERAIKAFVSKTKALGLAVRLFTVASDIAEHNRTEDAWGWEGDRPPDGWRQPWIEPLTETEAVLSARLKALDPDGMPGFFEEEPFKYIVRELPLEEE